MLTCATNVDMPYTVFRPLLHFVSTGNSSHAKFLPNRVELTTKLEVADTEPGTFYMQNSALLLSCNFSLNAQQWLIKCALSIGILSQGRLNGLHWWLQSGSNSRQICLCSSIPRYSVIANVTCTQIIPFLLRRNVDIQNSLRIRGNVQHIEFIASNITLPLHWCGKFPASEINNTKQFQPHRNKEKGSCSKVPQRVGFALLSWIVCVNLRSFIGKWSDGKWRAAFS